MFEPDPRHAELLLDFVGLMNAKPVLTLGVKDEVNQDGSSCHGRKVEDQGRDRRRFV